MKEKGKLIVRFSRKHLYQHSFLRCGHIQRNWITIIIGQFAKIARSCGEIKEYRFYVSSLMGNLFFHSQSSFSYFLNKCEVIRLKKKEKKITFSAHFTRKSVSILYFCSKYRPGQVVLKHPLPPLNASRALGQKVTDFRMKPFSTGSQSRGRGRRPSYN